MDEFKNFCLKFSYILLTILFWICNVAIYMSIIVQLVLLIFHKMGIGYISEVTLEDPLLWIPIMVFGAGTVLSFVSYKLRSLISLEVF